MRRRTDVKGDSLTEALTAAIAELAETEPAKVELSVNAPGLDPAESGPFRVRLEVAGGKDEAPDEDEAPISVEELDEEADVAADFVEGLLDRMKLPGDIQIRVLEDRAEVEVVEVGSGALIGRRGATLEAIQELLRCVLQRKFERRSRVTVDVEGYRARRLERLLEKADEAIEEVQDTGDPVRLEPMDAFERKAVHRRVAEADGVTSRSQGREPGRRVVIEPDDD